MRCKIHTDGLLPNDVYVGTGKWLLRVREVFKFNILKREFDSRLVASVLLSVLI